MFSIKGRTGANGQRKIRRSFSQLDNKMRKTIVATSKHLGLDASFDPKRLSINSLNFQAPNLKKKLSPLGATRQSPRSSKGGMIYQKT